MRTAEYLMNMALFAKYIRRTYWLLFVFLFLADSRVEAQTLQTIMYTTKDNLPSNGVYKTAVDKKGFLWVATENGLTRFDGKTFRTYTTQDGLTDNEVIDIAIDETGQVWVVPFRGRICYYNTFLDRFESEESQDFLKLPNAGKPYKPYVLGRNSIIFTSAGNFSYVITNNKAFHLDISAIAIKLSAGLGFFELSNGDIIAFHVNQVYRIKNNKYQAQAIMQLPVSSELTLQRNDKFYIAAGKTIYAYKIFDDGRIVLQNSKVFPFNLVKFNNGNNNILAISESGSVYIIDETTLEIKEELYVGYLPRYITQDYENNYWVSTLSNGLIKLQPSRIFTFDAAALRQNITSIQKGRYIFYGNNYGAIYAFDGLYGVSVVYEPLQSKADGIVRTIVPVGKNFFAAAQNGSVLFDQSGRVLKKFPVGYENRASKFATNYNDTTLLFGHHAATFLVDSRNFRPLDSVSKRVVSLGATASGKILIGSNDGLFIWKGAKALDTLAKISKALSYRVNDILTTSDKLTWIGLATDSLLVMNEKQVVARIGLGRQIPGNICKTIYSKNAGEVWLGTNKGLNRINYVFNENSFSYTSTYFGTADGLAGEEVNDLYISDSLVYAATSNGISYFDRKLKLPINDIATYITNVSVNDATLSLQDVYDLDYDQNNLTIKFSGVDLSGFVPLFEYSINGRNWQQVNQIELKNLPADRYTILIRAIKRDGLASNKVAKIVFDISAPFWKRSLFWAALALLLFGTILYAQGVVNKRRQKTVIQKIETEKRIAELEMQALKAQINPHFVFNCLNSIKGFIYDKDLGQADKYLDKFSDLMRSTIDNSDAALISLEKEVEYLHNYLELESLRFEDKFSYTVQIDNKIDLLKTLVPAMLLQPYVENAIRHGMRFLEGKKGLIAIGASLENEVVKFVVDDNGIGREQAALLKSKLHVEYQSKGMSISNRRADLYGIRMEILDKKDAHGLSLGTAIVLYIPKNLSL